MAVWWQFGGNMSAWVYNHVKTPRGEDFSVMVSLLSKAMRRGDEGSALYAAFELYLCGYQAAVGVEEERTRTNYRTRFVNRIAVAMMEDTVPTAPHLLLLIRPLTVAILEDHAEGAARDATLALLWEAVVATARAPKCRTMQHIRLVAPGGFEPHSRDPIWRAIVDLEASKPSGRPKTPRECLAIFDGVPSAGPYADRIKADMRAVFDLKKKPIVLVAALVCGAYPDLAVAPGEAARAPEDVRGEHADRARPDLAAMPFVFDKHVGNHIARPAFVGGTEPPRGWAGFVEHEEGACMERLAPTAGQSDLCRALAARYANMRSQMC